MDQIGHLSWLDIGIIALVLVGVTVFGHRVSGQTKSREEFFRGGGSLPWWAVSSSIIATVISSVSFVSIPSAVFRPGGDLGYIQILLGLMVGKAVVAAWFVRPLYESKTISTTYDYISQRLDRKVGKLSMVIGIVITCITASVKLLTSAVVLQVITDLPLPTCVFAVVVAAVLWSWIAGVKTVIWTDFALFAVFALGSIFAAYWTFSAAPIPLPETLQLLDEKAKLALFDFSVDPSESYTLWAGLFGASFLSLASVGTQGALQRIKSCRSVKDAQKAYVVSGLFYFIAVSLIIVGLGLSVFYEFNPLAGDVLTSLETQPDRIFPYFIATEIPDGISGIFIAAIFAAGISTVDTHLAEVADVSISNVYAPFIRTDASESHYLFASRAMIATWGLFFGALAVFFSRFQAEGLLDLTFKLPNYVWGATLGTIVLARIGVGTWRVYLFGLACTFLTVWFLQHWNVSFFWWVPVSAAVMIGIVWPMSGEKAEWGGVKVIEQPTTSS